MPYFFRHMKVEKVEKKERAFIIIVGSIIIASQPMPPHTNSEVVEWHGMELKMQYINGNKYQL